MTIVWLKRQTIKDACVFVNINFNTQTIIQKLVGIKNKWFQIPHNRMVKNILQTKNNRQTRRFTNCRGIREWLRRTHNKDGIQRWACVNNTGTEATVTSLQSWHTLFDLTEDRYDKYKDPERLRKKLNLLYCKGRFTRNERMLFLALTRIYIFVKRDKTLVHSFNVH